jgi:hypothetical protein
MALASFDLISMSALSTIVNFLANMGCCPFCPGLAGAWVTTLEAGVFII